MNLFLFPTLYKDTSGDITFDEAVFVRVGRKVKTIGYGEQWEWQKVEKVFPCIYKPLGKSFFDIKDMFTKVR